MAQLDELLRAAAIEPRSRRRVAMALANAAVLCSGDAVEISMGRIAASAGLSKGHTRKQVHALISMSVLEVAGNAHGGAPTALPRYRFNLQRLRALALHPGATADLFAEPPPTFSFHGLIAEDIQVPMDAVLQGPAGRRVVQFVRQSVAGPISYGQLSLQAVLEPLCISDAWSNGCLSPAQGSPDWAGALSIPVGTAEQLQTWAQEAALGRAESRQILNTLLVHRQGADTNDH